MERTPRDGRQEIQRGAWLGMTHKPQQLELFDELMNILTPRMKAQLAKSLHDDIATLESHEHLSNQTIIHNS